MVGEDWGAGSLSSSGPSALTQNQTSQSPASSASLHSHLFIHQPLIFIPATPLKLLWQKMIFCYQIQWPFSQFPFFLKNLKQSVIYSVAFCFPLVWGKLETPGHLPTSLLLLLTSPYEQLLHLPATCWVPRASPLALASHSLREPILSDKSATILKTAIPKLKVTSCMRPSSKIRMCGKITFLQRETCSLLSQWRKRKLAQTWSHYVEKDISLQTGMTLAVMRCSCGEDIQGTWAHLEEERLIPPFHNLFRAYRYVCGGEWQKGN